MVVLIVMVFLCVISYFCLKNYNTKRQEEENAQALDQDTSITVATIDTSTVTGFSYQLDGQTLSFSKNGENWQYDADASIAISEDSIASLLSNVTAVTADEVLTDVSDYSVYGLKEPANTINIKTGDQIYEFLVGDYNDTAECYYFKINDSDDVYTMKGGLCSAFQKTIEDLTETESVSDNASDS